MIAAVAFTDPLSAALDRARAYRSARLAFAPTTRPPDAECPSCGYEMTVTLITPTFLRDDCEDVTYTCRKCGTQIRRTVKSD